MKTSVYVPDDLAKQVRAHGISISEVTHAALRQAVEAASLRDRVMTDINAVAERLRSTIAEEDRRKYEEGRADGIEWAREYATANELEHMASYDFTGGDFEDHSVVDFMSTKESFTVTSVRPDIDDEYWTGFIAGAQQVWDAVWRLL
jgi:hypothetical protein